MAYCAWIAVARVNRRDWRNKVEPGYRDDFEIVYGIDDLIERCRKHQAVGTSVNLASLLAWQKERDELRAANEAQEKEGMKDESKQSTTPD